MNERRSFPNPTNQIIAGVIPVKDSQQQSFEAPTYFGLSRISFKLTIIV
ncbi:hypothetical protein [Paenisporosarcina antarctica]|nr:hypothetical protein [Paenisporosarcina antarctica]